MKYHYTYRYADWLGSILQMGIILPTSPTEPSSDVDPCPAVWFSTRSDYEPTALKPRDNGSLITPEEYCRIGARIVVTDDVAFTSWEVFRRTASARFHLPRKRASSEVAMRRRMEAVGRAIGGNPADWFCTYDPVPMKLWNAVEVCNEAGIWIALQCSRKV